MEWLPKTRKAKGSKQGNIKILDVLSTAQNKQVNIKKNKNWLKAHAKAILSIIPKVFLRIWFFA